MHDHAARRGPAMGRKPSVSPGASASVYQPATTLLAHQTAAGNCARSFLVGGAVQREEALLALQRAVGNRATASLVGGLAVQREDDEMDVAPQDEETTPLSSAAQDRLSSRMRSVKKMPSSEDYRARRRKAQSDRRGEQKKRQLTMSRFGPAVFSHPEYQFEVDAGGGEPERHRLYVEGEASDSTLMIASLPLPVGDFMLEMRARFAKLKNKALLAVNPLDATDPTLATYETDFVVNETAAKAALTIATGVLGSLTSTTQARLLAEEQVAVKLHPLIGAVVYLAKTLGRHYRKPSNRPQRAAGHVKGAGKKFSGVTNERHYLARMGSAAERYKIEGLVARYGEQPDYVNSKFDRDHQPHNGLIERVAKIPEFSGRRIRTVSQNHSLGAWTIMVHHDRHTKGRTYGSKAKTISGRFDSGLAAERRRLAQVLLGPVTLLGAAVQPVGAGTPAAAKAAKAVQEAMVATTAASTAHSKTALAVAAIAHAYTKLQALAGIVPPPVLGPLLSAAQSVDLQAKQVPADVRAWCIDHLIDSMKMDVADMKAVAAGSTNFADIVGLGLGAAQAQQIADVQNQIELGENRILTTEDEIRAFAT